jgi:hypothetical protein
MLAVSSSPVLLGLGAVVIVLDTGGLHWFAASMIRSWWLERKARKRSRGDNDA